MVALGAQGCGEIGLVGTVSEWYVALGAQGCEEIGLVGTVSGGTWGTRVWGNRSCRDSE